MKTFAIFKLLILSITIQQTFAIWCYRCTSATPGCGDNFNWRGIGYWGEHCPEDEDICVKVTERRGAKETIIRECLSALNFRTDIPADKYEGCRKAAVDGRLAHYVNHTVKEHDVRRDYFTDVEYCFCFLDHRCNGASTMTTNIAVLAIALVGYLAVALS
ncbi:uncharacterized protein LOC129941394 [Eupeodes corollae]|uniref:uncharacterized protein LOC129941394 n=1 Tax=Eupeodes corollae TaxID=290404 RepID=UPI002491FA62|nr:uncharacterized protein LOC129941394 [Eupeodes corollae]